jgi:anti-anti-sigma regulatory factor
MRKPLLREFSKTVMRFNENCSMNGTGIAILIRLLTESNRKNHLVAITGLSQNFKKVFELVGI